MAERKHARRLTRQDASAHLLGDAIGDGRHRRAPAPAAHGHGGPGRIAASLRSGRSGRLSWRSGLAPPWDDGGLRRHLSSCRRDGSPPSGALRDGGLLSSRLRQSAARSGTPAGQRQSDQTPASLIVTASPQIIPGILATGWQLLRHSGQHSCVRRMIPGLVILPSARNDGSRCRPACRLGGSLWLSLRLRQHRLCGCGGLGALCCCLLGGPAFMAVPIACTPYRIDYHKVDRRAHANVIVSR